MNSEIQKKIAFKEYNQADKIIRYLLNPNDETELSVVEKRTLDICKKIHNYRSAYHKRKDIVALLVSTEDIKERQAYNLINTTEEIFGRVEPVHKEYERNFLLEVSRKNIQLAAQGRSSMLLTKALMAHYKIAGLDLLVPDMPDFTNLEQHMYMINLPTAVLDALKTLVSSGHFKLSDILPPPKIILKDTDEAEEVKE